VFFTRFSQNCEKRLLASSCLSVSPFSRNISVPNGWNLCNFTQGDQKVSMRLMITFLKKCEIF
jgi:hypothetical protein